MIVETYSSMKTNATQVAGSVSTVTPVLLAGGIGTRLWPLSRPEFPKQFSIQIDARSLFEHTLHRLNGEMFGTPIITCQHSHLDHVIVQTRKADANEATLICEPSPKNTAASVLMGALCAHEENPETILLVCPTDHWIADPSQFVHDIRQSLPLAQDGKLVVFGIRPDAPVSDFGYIRPDTLCFEEKPPKARARHLIKSGALWNSGMICAKAQTLISQFKKLTPDLYAQCADAWQTRHSNATADIIEAQTWDNLDPISFDHAILERSGIVDVVPLSTKWSDLGNWDRLELFFSVEQIEQMKSHTCPTTHMEKPWGSFDVLRRGPRHQVKSLTLDVGQTLSLQSHHHRSEHWIVVQGTSQINLDAQSILKAEGEHIHIPIGAVHRIRNRGKIPLIVIEVQCGSYLEEDDIIRYDDAYGRG